MTKLSTNIGLMYKFSGMQSQKHFICKIDFFGETKIFLFVHVRMCIAILVILLKTQQFSFSLFENFNKCGFSEHFV